MSFTEDRTALL